VKQLTGKPRNRKAKLEAVALHAYVRDIVRLIRCECRYCGGRPPAYVVRQHLPEQFQDRAYRTLRTHIREVIEEEAEIDGRPGSLLRD
jgi:hypothetical protein